MNIELYYSVKQIVEKAGETILTGGEQDGKDEWIRRVNAFLSDLAKDVPKPPKTVFVKCLEYGYVSYLKESAEKDRADMMNKLSRRMNEEEGYSEDLCMDTLQLLASILYGEKVAMKYLTVTTIDDRFQEARKLYLNKQYDEAMPQLEALAQEGYAKAQYQLGFIYFWGAVTGIQQNTKKALEWYNKAADQGNVEALSELSRIYERRDPAKAAEYFRKAGEQGDAYGQYRIGYAYEFGEGVAQDKAKAAEWYAKAAEQGDATAQYNLADLYYEGDGVPKDRVKAELWFRRAAEQGDEDAQKMVRKIEAMAAADPRRELASHSAGYTLNVQFLNIVKRMIDKEGEAVLFKRSRVNALLSDLAHDVPKPLRNAFVKCLDYKPMQMLKGLSEGELKEAIQKLAERINDEEGYDLDLCGQSLALIAAVI